VRARRFAPSPRRGEGDGVTIFPYRTVRDPSSALFPNVEKECEALRSLKATAQLLIAFSGEMCAVTDYGLPGLP